MGDTDTDIHHLFGLPIHGVLVFFLLLPILAFNFFLFSSDRLGKSVGEEGTSDQVV